MVQRIGRYHLTTFVLASALFLTASELQAQIVRAPLTDGFQRTSSINVSMDEMLGTQKSRSVEEPILGPGYPDLWIAEVQFKPLRLMRLELTNPATGKVEKELVRYLVWRMIRRDPTELAGKDRAELERKLFDPERDPSNDLDQKLSLPLRLPRFVLETQDREGNVLQAYTDEINPNVQAAVFNREMGRRGQNLRLMNSIEAISEIGDPILSASAAASAAAAAGADKEAAAQAAEAADAEAVAKAIYGVAVWRNVDPSADFLSVSMSGFTNAYRISQDASGERIVEEKVVVQRFARPGDQYLQDETEFRIIDEVDTDSDGKADTRFPIWKYRLRTTKLDIPEMDSVLRNVRKTAEQPTAPVEN
jgi:hypothetical protein